METSEKSVARRFYEIINSGRIEVLDQICAADLRGRAGAGADLAELKSGLSGFREPFAGLTADVRHLVLEGDTISAWVSYTAKHQADFAGVPASGRRVKFAAWDVMRVRDGRIVEITQYCDLFTIMSQIGPLPTAAPA